MTTIALAYALGLLGVLAHWAKKFTRGQTMDGILDHFKENIPYTVRTLATLIGAIAGLTAAGVDLSDTKDISILFLTGYGIDSAVNKNSDQ